MSILDRELIITSIINRMRKNRISITDLPAGAALEHKLNTATYTNSSLWESLKLLVDKVYELYPNDLDAYAWFSENLDSQIRADLGIFKPKHYKIVECTITRTIAVPENYTDSNVMKVIHSMPPKDNWRFEVSEDKVSDMNIDRFDYDNNIDNLEWSDEYL